MTRFLTFAAFLAVPFLVAFALRRWVRHQPDGVIDSLIAQNAARYREGMETVDWQKTKLAGRKVWVETMLAQHRYLTQPEQDDDQHVH